MNPSGIVPRRCRVPKLPNDGTISACVHLVTFEREWREREFANLPIILIVEDDELLQGFFEDALREGGFENATVRSGEEAITLLKSRLVQYSALLTDVNLVGRFDGWAVASAAREIDPTFPVVYMSGADAHQWAARGVPESTMLQKPFRAAQLTTALSQLLNGCSPRSSGVCVLRHPACAHP